VVSGGREESSISALKKFENRFDSVFIPSRVFEKGISTDDRLMKIKIKIIKAIYLIGELILLLLF